RRTPVPDLRGRRFPLPDQLLRIRAATMQAAIASTELRLAQTQLITRQAIRQFATAQVRFNALAAAMAQASAYQVPRLRVEAHIADEIKPSGLGLAEPPRLMGPEPVTPRDPQADRDLPDLDARTTADSEAGSEPGTPVLSEPAFLEGPPLADSTVSSEADSGELQGLSTGEFVRQLREAEPAAVAAMDRASAQATEAGLAIREQTRALTSEPGAAAPVDRQQAIDDVEPALHQAFLAQRALAATEVDFARALHARLSKASADARATYEQFTAEVKQAERNLKFARNTQLFTNMDLPGVWRTQQDFIDLDRRREADQVAVDRAVAALRAVEDARA
ncbi:MAG: hypothetical protein ACRC0L_00750, partial [Angustibacter sp.]